MSVVEVEGSQARTLLGKCIHMREGAGVERLDVMRLDSGTLAGGGPRNDAVAMMHMSVSAFSDLAEWYIVTCRVSKRFDVVIRCIRPQDIR